MSDPAPTRLGESLKGLADSGLATLQTRLELFSVEIKEEMLRAGDDVAQARAQTARCGRHDSGRNQRRPMSRPMMKPMPAAMPIERHGLSCT